MISTTTDNFLTKAGTRASDALPTGMDSIQESVSEVSRNVRDAIEDAVAHGKTSSRHFSRQIAGTAKDLAERGRSGAQYVGGYVRSHALMTTLISVGAGLLVARLLFRR